MAVCTAVFVARVVKVLEPSFSFFCEPELWKAVRRPKACRVLDSWPPSPHPLQGFLFTTAGTFASCSEIEIGRGCRRGQNAWEWVSAWGRRGRPVVRALSPPSRPPPPPPPFSAPPGAPSPPATPDPGFLFPQSILSCSHRALACALSALGCPHPWFPSLGPVFRARPWGSACRRLAPVRGRVTFREVDGDHLLTDIWVVPAFGYGQCP